MKPHDVLVKFPKLSIILLIVMIHYFPAASPFVEHTFCMGLNLDPQCNKCRSNFSNCTIYFMSIHS